MILKEEISSNTLFRKMFFTVMGWLEESRFFMLSVDAQHIILDGRVWLCVTITFGCVSFKPEIVRRVHPSRASTTS